MSGGRVKLLTNCRFALIVWQLLCYITCGCSLQSVTGHILGKILCWTAKKDGSLYTKSAAAALCYGLQKHFIKNCIYDIINDPELRASNEMFGAVLLGLCYHYCTVWWWNVLKPFETFSLFTCALVFLYFVMRHNKTKRRAIFPQLRANNFQ